MLKKILFLLAFFPATIFAQHTIKGTFSPSKDFKQVILYKVEPTNMAYISYAALNKNGQFTLKLGKTIKPGIYRLVYGVPQEEKNFDIIFNAKEDLAFNFGIEGLEYTTSNENMLLQNYYREVEAQEQEITSFYKEKKPKKRNFKKMFNALKNIQNKYEEAAKGTMALHFIKANRPYFPTTYQDIKTYKNNIKNTFFDAVDFNNVTLQSSNFLTQLIYNYVFVLNTESEQANALDKVVNQIGKQNDIKKNFLEMFWFQASKSQNQTLANYITTNYLLDLAKAEKDHELVEAITLFKAISFGQIAPDFSWEIKDKTKKFQSLSELDDIQNYILFFWSSTCSHCLMEIPKLRDYVKTKTKKQFKVIAIGLENEPFNWKNEIYNYPGFTHVYGQGKWNNKIANAYGIKSTPTYFVLDKDKKIIAKPAHIGALKAFFEGE